MCRRKASTLMRLAYTLASAAIHTITVITIIMVADMALGTAAHLIGPFRAEFVSLTVTVRGTCMALVTATGVNQLRGRLRAALLFEELTSQVLRSRSGSFAALVAIRRASSSLSNFAAERRPTR